MDEMTLESISKMENNIGQNNPVQSARHTADEISIKNNEEQQNNSAREVSEKGLGNRRGYSLNEVELKFDVDKNTDEVTVFVLDKSSRSVLRTIPPEELHKLDAGDLLELTA